MPVSNVNFIECVTEIGQYLKKLFCGLYDYSAGLDVTDETRL